jgi:hypothetical protein
MGCSLLRAEGFSCSLDVLYGDIRISKMAIFDKKNFLSCKFFPKFGLQNSGSGLDPDPKAGSGSGINKS